MLSDDALDDNLTLVGFGVDPLSLLTTDQIVSWEKMGATSWKSDRAACAPAAVVISSKT